MIVRAALGGARLRVAPFRIRHDLPRNINRGRRTGPATGILALQLFLDFVQRIPARIADMLLTMTLLDIQIAAAQRTQTFAIFAHKARTGVASSTCSRSTSSSRRPSP